MIHFYVISSHICIKTSAADTVRLIVNLKSLTITLVLWFIVKLFLLFSV